jgi:hypothetical protein
VAIAKAAGRRGKRRARGLTPPDNDIAVYDGRELLGVMLWRCGTLAAIDAGGKKLGAYETERDARDAIHAARDPKSARA